MIPFIFKIEANFTWHLDVEGFSKYICKISD